MCGCGEAAVVCGCEGDALVSHGGWFQAGGERSWDEWLMRTRSGDAVSGEAVPKCDGIKSRQFTV